MSAVNKKVKVFFRIFIIIIASILLLSFFSKDILINIKKSYAAIHEKENSIEIACVGNSNLYSAFSPLDLWNDYGYTSTVCASARQTIEESFYIMKKHFEKQSPQLVIIETDMLFDHNPSNKNFCQKSHCTQDFFSRINPLFLKEDIKSIFSTLKNENTTHGYRYSSKKCRIEYNDYMMSTAEAEPIPQNNINQMNKLINLCTESNAEVLLISIPSISSWNYERHNSTAAFAKERNIPFLDFNLLYNEIKLDISQCFRDNGSHLNYVGATVITKYVGKFIQTNYEINNLKMNNEFYDWNENYMHFFNYKLECETSLFS